MNISSPDFNNKPSRIPRCAFLGAVQSLNYEALGGIIMVHGKRNIVISYFAMRIKLSISTCNIVFKTWKNEFQNKLIEMKIINMFL